MTSEDDGGIARAAERISICLPRFDVAPHVVVHRESQLTATLATHGISFDVVPELIETPTRARAARPAPLLDLSLNLAGLPLAVKRLGDIARARRARVLYSFATWSHYVAVVASMRLAAEDVGVVWHLQGVHAARASSMAGRMFARSSTVRGIIAVSQAAARPYVGVRPPITIVHNPGAAGDAETRRHALREQFALPPDAVLAGYAGRLVAHKGIWCLIDAARIALVENPRLHLFIFGGNPRHETRDVVGDIRRQVRAWSIDAQVHATGYVPDLAPALADLDMLIMPSMCEDACPCAVVEALTLGVPVIGSRVGGIPELVRDNVDGMLVPPGSPRELADAMSTLARDSERRRAMSKAARATAARRFDAVDAARRIAVTLHAAARGS